MTKSDKFVVVGAILVLIAMVYYNVRANWQTRMDLEGARTSLARARAELASESESRMYCLDLLETEMYDHHATLMIASAAIDLVDWELSQSAQVCEEVN